MMLWHLLSFSQLSFMGLFMIFPVVFLSLIYFIHEEMSVLLELEIFSFEGLAFNFPLLVDKTSLLFSSVVVIISISVMLFSVSYMSKDIHLEYFTCMVLLFVLSMNFLIFIPHMIFLLLGWDGLGLTSYLLVIYYQNNNSLGAGMITVMSNRVGDSFLILTLCWCFANGCWLVNLFNYGFIFVCSICLTLGAMTKSAQIPFSAWLPAAMAAPTPVSSLVHSSTLVTAGIYLLIRFYPCLTIYYYFYYFVFFIGVFTCLMASMSAFCEYDLKKIVALSTLSQLGVMMMSLGLGFPLLAFFHLITHALFKALLFICAGTIIHSMSNNQDIRLMGSLWQNMPVCCTSLNVANLALCGFPFTAGFYSKDLIVESFLFSKFPITTSFFMLLSVCLTGGYSVRLSIFTMWSPYKGSCVIMSSDESITTYFSFFLLMTGTIMGGSLLSWLLCSFLGLMILPFKMKILTLISILMITYSFYWMVNLSKKWPSHHFLGTMWFLSFITSYPVINSTLSVSNNYYLQENSWMELLSGKGILTFFSHFSSLLQKSQGTSFSQMFSLFTLFLGWLIFFY